MFPTVDCVPVADATALIPPEALLTLESKERARKREIASYLSAASIPPHLLDSDSPSRQVSNDASLTALVQLGAFRINTERAFLSLIDGNYQYIVSEATRTHSLVLADESMFLGVSKLNISFGVCPRTMNIFNDETDSLVIDTPNIVANRSRYIIHDFRADPHYKDRPYVTGFPHMVSYAEVPLVSPLGYILGSYCVVDNQKRDFDNPETISVLAEIASTIMRHLDMVRLIQNRTRAESLIRGLGEFMQSGSHIPIRNPNASIPENLQVTSGTWTLSDTSRELATSSGSNEIQTLDILNEATIATPTTSGTSATEIGTPTDLSLATPPTTPPQLVERDPFIVATSASQEGDTINHGSSDCTVVVSEPDAEYQQGIHIYSHSEQQDESQEPAPAQHQDSAVSVDIKETFTRAAAIIRETMSLDGLVFLDACPSGFGSRSKTVTTHEQQDPYQSDTADEGAIIEIEDIVLEAEMIAGSLASGIPLEPSRRRLPEDVVQRLIRRFPRGHVFSADEFGPIEDRFGPGKAKAQNIDMVYRQSTRSRDVDEMFRLADGARYIIFLPLWHFQREAWFGATFGWTTSSIQAIDIDDLNLLAAFGNSVMAEVSRFEALAVSKAKSDFISSISHELRSPLHGILASGELLREAVEDPTLLSMLDMIDTCGTTLLDTFNNLLDYAKINHSAPSGPQSKGTKSVAFEPPLKGSLSLVDLSKLVQDVVETVHVGHDKATLPMAPQGNSLYGNSDQGGERRPDTTVLVTVHIEKQPTWTSRLDVGAWKRIVMNIFGNSLKYTRSGEIEVGLKLVEAAGFKKRIRPHVCLSVQDTGIGMSSDYLKYQLFTPFAQENQLSPGTGLGLSIVQSIVKSLQGTLDVQSQIGVGTCIKVFIPLHPDTTAPATPGNLPFARISSPVAENSLKRKTLCYVSPEAYRSLVDSSLDITSEGLERALSIQKALTQIASDILGMNVTICSSERVTTADVYFFDAHDLERAGYGDISPKTISRVLHLSPLVIFCSGRPGAVSLLKSERLRKHTFPLRYSIGPKKLSSVLLAALSRKPFEINTSPALTALTLQTKNLRPALPPRSTSGSSLSPVSPVSPISLLENHSDRPKNLLLVDDNAINLRILTTVVKKMNCTYLPASNGLEAVQIYKASASTTPIDLIFMDINMPVMDGFTATREIRKFEREFKIKATKIVALTGLGSADSRQEAFTSGTNLFMTKPVRLVEMRKLLTEGFDEQGDVEKEIIPLSSVAEAGQIEVSGADAGG